MGLRKMELGERRSKILAAVVNDYVRTAEPVASEILATKYDFGIKPAMIRHELATMSEMGYLKQPHTSAGRVPSDRGYRYYVDVLMPKPRLRPSEVRQIVSRFDPYESEVENLIHQTCRILAGLAQYTSLATSPHMDAVSIRHVALSGIGDKKLLLVTVLSTSQVDHRILDYQGDIGWADITAMGNIINEQFRGVDIAGFDSVQTGLPDNMLRFEDIYRKVIAMLRQALHSVSDTQVYVDGAAHILKQPEFANTKRVAAILEALEQRTVLFQVLSAALLGKDVTVIIGSENRFAELQECSFVTTNYRIGDRVCGSIGVVGPTRMDYRRAVAAVQFMASNLSQMLTQMSVG